MNQLIFFNDDGISPLAWGRRVIQALNAGKLVIAVTDTNNTDECIGIGDGLPAYAYFGLANYSNFQSLLVSGPDDPALLSALARANENTLIAWNMDLLDWARGPQPELFHAVVAACRKTRADNLVVTYLYMSYGVASSDEPYLKALSTLDFTSVGGRGLTTATGLVEVVAPSLVWSLRPPKPLPPPSILTRLFNHKKTSTPSVNNQSLVWAFANTQGLKAFHGDWDYLWRSPEHLELI